MSQIRIGSPDLERPIYILVTFSNLTKALPYFQDLGKKTKREGKGEKEERVKRNSARIYMCICVRAKDVIVTNKKTDVKRKVKEENKERKRQM